MYGYAYNYLEMIYEKCESHGRRQACLGLLSSVTSVCTILYPIYLVRHACVNNVDPDVNNVDPDQTTS